MALGRKKDKMVNIMANGSKWMGELPDTLDTLESRLKIFPLDKTFEEYGNFAYKEKGKYYIFGNFKNLSAVFNIETDEKPVFLKFKRLIRINQKRNDYKE